MLVASPELDVPWQSDRMGNVEILRLKTPRTKDIGYLRRTIGEFLMPHAMLRNMRKSPLASARFDGVIWYSPTIFLAPIVRALKAESGCPAYLIIRDIFPQWAADMGLMSRGLAYRVLDRVALQQYRAADVIGVQTPGNLAFFEHLRDRLKNTRFEVLQNWLADAPDRGCVIDLASGTLRGRKVFAYAGNMGIAQGMDKLLDLADRTRARTDAGFLFVGRGSEAKRLEADARQRGLSNVLFHDEIDPDDIPGLYAQCHAGIVCLDARHKTHNIPGKFISYMQAGLPVLASVNAGNDLIAMIETEGVGRASVDPFGADLDEAADALLDRPELTGTDASERCRILYRKLFSPEAAAAQVVSALESVRQ